VLAELRETLQAETQLSGLWLVSEDNGFDQLDADNRGAFGSTARGVFHPHWYRDANNAVIQDTLGGSANETADRNQSFYRRPVSRGRMSLIDPYERQLDSAGGRRLLVATVAVPIFSAGRLAGVLGADFRLDGLSGDGAREGLQKGQQFVLVTGDGRVIAASDRRRVGTFAATLGMGPKALERLGREKGGHALTDWGR
jgi:methyl-accepting chemotaxis protein